MNLVAMCIVLNEERNIERFCEAYSRFADKVVICDGGSIDKTVELAEPFPKVEAVHFGGLMDFDGFPWTPLGKHHNFAYRIAMETNPDWIITDECDSIPTLSLQKTIRSVLETSEKDIIGLRRIYILGEDKFFRNLSFKGYFGWAHRPDKVDGHFRTTTHLGIPRPNFPHPDSGLWNTLGPPYGLLHYGWPDEETVAEKTERYRASGSLPEHGHPIPGDSGEPEDLPDWAIWN